ncbi:MAG: DnaB-like helicase C-terminal domain-containing protein [Bacteroidota bacterium]
MKSEIIVALKKMIENENAEDDDIVQELQALIYNIEAKNNEYKDAEALSSLFAKNLDIIKNGKANTGIIYTGYREMDYLLNGFSLGELIVIGGRPGIGKTALVLNILLHISKENPVLYFNLNSSNINLSRRILSIISSTATERFNNPMFKDEFEQKLIEISPIISEYKINFNPHYDQSLNSFKAYCKKEIDSKGIKVIVIDHLQLIGITNFKYNRDQEISIVTAFLKKMASELNIIIIATSQLSRANENRRGDKRPQLSDLRESGSIEQIANKVILVHRPEYYGIIETADVETIRGLMQIFVAKNDTGNTGELWLKFIHENSKIEDWKF